VDVAADSMRSAEAEALSNAAVERLRERKLAGASRLRLRTLYFAIAAIWGFATGAAGLAAGLALGGRPVELDPQTSLALAACGVLALAGGLGASLAYRQASSGFRTRSANDPVARTSRCTTAPTARRAS
jgi:hypothetical protein